MHRKQSAKIVSAKEYQITYFSPQKQEYYREWYGARSEDLALIGAVMQNDLNKAHQYIRDGANVNIMLDHDQPHWGWTPLKKAIEIGSLEMAQLLIDAGANVNESTDTSGVTGGDYARAPDDNVRNNTLLSYAVMLNKPEMVKLLIKHGADVNERDPVFKRWSPLRIAEYNGYKEIIKILKEAGAH